MTWAPELQARGPPEGVGDPISWTIQGPLVLPPSNQAAEMGPLAGPLKGGGQEFRCKEQISWGQRAGPLPGPWTYVLCPGDVGLQEWPDPTAV